jgi:hypothetical protein
MAYGIMNSHNVFTFKKFYENLLDDEERLAARRKRIEESMSAQNKKPPVIDANGRYHAPYDGYQWSGGFSRKSFLGGEYLPVDDFAGENNYYKLSKETAAEILDIPCPIAREMVEMNLSREGGVIHIKRHNQNQAHYNKNKIKVITCEASASKWCLKYFSEFIKHYMATLCKCKLKDRLERIKIQEKRQLDEREQELKKLAEFSLSLP